MPGILPMKVIKVGTNSQTRIAQACDRCRSKKIRCDGIRPTCSQCANVGFECKTSDKLSRRAFPRGYTESLEERVRGLEQEVRELKDLLDEKDEKIDMLSRLHSRSSQAKNQLPSPRRPSATSSSSKESKGGSPTTEDIFKVQQSPNLVDGEGNSSYFSGTSSGRTFIEVFKHKVQETGRSTNDIDSDRLLDNTVKSCDALADGDSSVVWKAPPRLTSDQLIQHFFQEWAPLFPVLHRPSFLTLYDKYVTDSDSVTDKAEIAQLNLVFGIALLSSGTRSSEDLESFEIQWKAAIDSVLKENSMATLQALILAQIFCVQQGDLTSLLLYKGLAITLCTRLGLHQSQKRFALGTLTCETRKKVFWTLYTVDSFTAVILGAPKHLKDDDIQCEDPVDADDEHVTERGFEHSVPGETTKLSSALALFRAARILSKVLAEIFPAKQSYELSFKKLSDLSDELDAWSAALPTHLQLPFAQDKPSAGTVTSRSPLLALTYHYIRALIQRPVVCASLGNRTSSAMMTMATSCKHMIQVIELLVERGMQFSMCLNRDEVLVLCGFGLMFQGLNLDSNSKILKDNQKMVSAVVTVLENSAAPCASEFKRVARSFMPSLPDPPKQCEPPKIKKPSMSRHNSDGMVAPVITPSSPTSTTKKNLKSIASRFTSSGSPKKPSFDVADQRRATVHNISLHPQGAASQSAPSLQPPRTAFESSGSTSRSEPARSPINLFSRTSSGTAILQAPSQALVQPPKTKLRPNAPTLTNLDYLSFGNELDFQTQSSSRSAHPIKTEPGPTDWEKLIGNLDNGHSNIYDACYGGPSVENMLDMQSLGMQHANSSATTMKDVSWNADLWALAHADTNASNNSIMTGSSGHTDSLLSFTTDERERELNNNNSNNNEEFNDIQYASGNAAGPDSYRGLVVPAELGNGNDLKFGDSWDTHLNL